jgi:hypothetical protein
MGLFHARWLVQRAFFISVQSGLGRSSKMNEKVTAAFLPLSAA